MRDTSQQNNITTMTPAAQLSTSTGVQTSITTLSRLTETPSLGNTIPVCPGNGVHLSPSEGFGFSSAIIYQIRGSNKLFAIGGNPLQSSAIPINAPNGFIFIGISPDGNWLAYYPKQYSQDEYPTVKNPAIRLLSSDGTHKEIILNTDELKPLLQDEEQFVGFSTDTYWINNKLIYGTLLANNPDQQTTGSIDHLREIFDPFRGIWRGDLLDNLPQRDTSSSVGISPDLSRALYEGNNGLTLWDLENNKVIWNNLDILPAYGALIYWAPNNSMAVYSQLSEPPDQNGVLLITRDGKVKSIYNSQSSSPNNLIYAISWSHDSRYIALIAEGDIGSDVILYIYDTENDKFISQCPITKTTELTPSLYWSPDDSFVACTGGDSSILIEVIKTGEVFEMVQNGVAYGWSDKFPVVGK
jgi:WD40 repeat protein